MKKYLAVFLVCVSSFCFGDWMEEQIEEDLAILTESPITEGNLKEGFKELCSRPEAQAAYFEIRRGRVKKRMTTPIKNEERMAQVYLYLKRLSRKYSLPDLDMIISTHDGEVVDNAFPLFAFAKKEGTRNVLLFPDMDAFDMGDKEQEFARKLSKRFPWETKKEIAFFRGSTTGECDPTVFAFGNDRARVIYYSYEYPSLVDATFSQLIQYPEPILQEMGNWLALIGKSLDERRIADHYAYKYLLDVDGNSCTYLRCRWILSSNSTLVKVMTDNTQWYYKALDPWHHYVPVKQDLSDLEAAISFLRENDEIAFQIAGNGQDLAREIFSKEAVDRYVVSLLDKYAKCFRK